MSLQYLATLSSQPSVQHNSYAHKHTVAVFRSSGEYTLLGIRSTPNKRGSEAHVGYRCEKMSERVFSDVMVSLAPSMVALSLRYALTGVLVPRK